VRGRTSLPPLLAALRKAGIDYRGVELESLADRPAVRDLVALAKAMLHGGDRTAWLSVLRAPWCGLMLADLHQLAAGTDAPLAASIGELAALARLSDDGRERLAIFAPRLDAAIADRGSRSLGSWLKAAWLAIAGPATIDDVSDLANAELLFAALDLLEAESGSLPEASAIDTAVQGVKNLRAAGVPIEDAREVSRYVAALERGMKLLRSGLPISHRLITDIHKALLDHPRGRGKAPGELRRSQVWIGGTRPGNAAFVPPPASFGYRLDQALAQYFGDNRCAHSGSILHIKGNWACWANCKTCWTLVSAISRWYTPATPMPHW